MQPIDVNINKPTERVSKNFRFLKLIYLTKTPAKPHSWTA